jgi:sugar lactone lactonase YvrE
MMSCEIRNPSIVLSSLLVLGAPSTARAQEIVPFDSPRWTRAQSEVVEIGGRQALQGVAALEDVDFRDGVVEFDLYITGARSYPGVYFRMGRGNNAEHFYVRPHRAGLYPDAIQYTPIVNGVGEWQLHNGPGYTSAGSLPEDEWFPVRVEVKGKQARAFIGDLSEPALTIPYLEGTTDRGGLALTGPVDGSAYFSNFRYDTEAEPFFDPAPERELPEGLLREWEVSPAIPVGQVRRESYPGDFSLFLTEWQPLEADARGLVDLARRATRQNPDGDLAFARHVFYSEEDRVMNLDVGYSDEVDLFFNGRRVFSGQSRYQGRDPSFLGILGLYDQVPVQVRKGLNEVFVTDAEYFGGWGFMVKGDGTPAPKPTDYGATEEVWATEDVFLTPESVLKDPNREILYVTNFDTNFAQKPEPSGFISRLSLEGQVLDLKWVEGLMAPCGMDIWRDTLFVAERRHLLAVDLATGTVANRWEIPEGDFPNDVVIDDHGTVYISDTRSQDPTDSRIYRFREGTFDVFVNAGIDRANGIWIHDGWLYIGNTGDGMLKKVELATGRMEDVVSFGAGILDGIRVDQDGNLLVSHWFGRLYRITPGGDLTEILHSEDRGWNTADFEYLPEERLVVIPTFLDNRVRAVRVLH